MVELSQSRRVLLYVQLSWAALCALWNGAGVALLSQGYRSPGPTASWLAAAALVAIGVGLVVGFKYVNILYLLLSAVSALLAMSSIATAFMADPVLWPSDFGDTQALR